MARLARIVIPDCPHHVIQRGVRSLPIFASDADRKLYLGLLMEHAEQFGIEFWAWCLMTNHVHLVAVPSDPDALARGIGEAHRRFTRHINARAGVAGHLFQERFHSFPIQHDGHLLNVVRYVELNPVRAGLSNQAHAYAWSSAAHHALGKPDPLVRNSPVRDLAPDWKDQLRARTDPVIDDIRRHTRTGRPFGDQAWVKKLERKLRRPLLAKPSGRPKEKS
ncbi:MAG: transposase [Candidatus Hydrogenedentota bacterium]